MCWYETVRKFLLTGNDGSTWEVRSSRVDLAEHVGHTVTATGVVSNATMHNMKEDAKDAAKDSGMKTSGAEHRHMKIVVSADGKSRTVTTSGTDAMGKKISSTAVYDKQ